MKTSPPEPTRQHAGSRSLRFVVTVTVSADTAMQVIADEIRSNLESVDCVESVVVENAHAPGAGA